MVNYDAINASCNFKESSIFKLEEIASNFQNQESIGISPKPTKMYVPSTFLEKQIEGLQQKVNSQQQVIDHLKSQNQSSENELIDVDTKKVCVNVSTQTYLTAEVDHSTQTTCVSSTDSSTQILTDSLECSCQTAATIADDYVQTDLSNDELAHSLVLIWYYFRFFTCDSFKELVVHPKLSASIGVDTSTQISCETKDVSVQVDFIPEITHSVKLEKQDS